MHVDFDRISWPAERRESILRISARRGRARRRAADVAPGRLVRGARRARDAAPCHGCVPGAGGAAATARGHAAGREHPVVTNNAMGMHWDALAVSAHFLLFLRPAPSLAPPASAALASLIALASACRCLRASSSSSSKSGPFFFFCFRGLSCRAVVRSRPPPCGAREQARQRGEEGSESQRGGKAALARPGVLCCAVLCCTSPPLRPPQPNTRARAATPAL